MKLFTYATSPYARKVRMALDYKNVSYEPFERCYSLDRKEDLRCVNVRAEVPTLVLDDGRTIADSTVIAEYIEEVYPAPPLYPKDPYERSRMRMIEDLCDRSFDAVGFGFWLAVLREQAPESQAMKQAAADELRDLLATLERELGEQNFFCGELIKSGRFRGDLLRAGRQDDGREPGRVPPPAGLDGADAPHACG
jgi:glutathione S-transferase